MTEQTDSASPEVSLADTLAQQSTLGRGGMVDGLGMATLDHGAALRGVLANLFGDDAAVDEESATIGRFIVLRCLGTGGMGSVYEARDPKLDRRVAVKVLHSDGLSGERLVEEGKAMARLNHPNVVTVYEVDTAGDRAFVAMELIEGVTLRRWQNSQARPWSEILTMYRAVGLGVAAAHDAGLVHCDLKPENVLVGDDGRARVTDFGISVLGHELTPAPATTEDNASVGLTSSVLSGTPRYMSPEQYLGSAVDHRADQFALCVMLWEALFGTSPFSGDTLMELAESITTGQLAVPPQRTSVPAWLRKVCERGLAREPAERWPDTRALLAALDRGRSRARWRAGLATVAVVGMTAAAVWGAQRWQHAKAVDHCEAQGNVIDAVWNAERREQIRAAMLGTGVRHAAATLDKVEPWIDEHTSSWANARTETCLRHDVEQTWDDDLRARARWCLADRRAELELVLEELGAIDRKTIGNAVRLAALPADVSTCVDEDRLRRIPMPATEELEPALVLRRERARVQAMNAAGRATASLTVAEQAVAKAEQLGWGPLTASLRGTLGETLYTTGDIDRAAEMLVEAYFEAMTQGAVLTALDAATSLVKLEGESRENLEAAQLWARHTDVLLDMLHMRGTPHEGIKLEFVAGSLLHAGRLDEARATYEQAMAVFIETLGSDHPQVLSVLGAMSAVARESGDSEEAVALATRALEQAEAIYGVGHPKTAAKLVFVGTALSNVRRFTDALPLLERAHVLLLEDEGPQGPRVGEVLTNLGNIHGSLGNQEQSVNYQEQALAILEGKLGPDHLHVGMALNNLANAHRHLEHHERAREALTRALAIFEAKLESEYPHVAFVEGNLGDVEWELDNHERAAGHYQRSLQIRERELGADHPRVLVPLLGLGQVRLAQGQVERADAIAARALTLVQDDASGMEPRARAQLLRANVDWALGRRESAVTRVRALGEALRTAGEQGELMRNNVETWFAEHPVDGG